tara:strand:+ start:183 stop:1322 length:1140 start_codon:yes stop_codon:yes gene_type:complete
MIKIEKFFKFLLPPFTIHLIKFIYFKLPFVNFKKYWIKNRKHFLNLKEDNLNLIDSTDNFVNSPSYNLVSNYWQSLNIKNYNSILTDGLDKLTNEIFTNYHTFLYFDNDLIEKSTKHLTDINLNYKVHLFKKHKNLNFEKSLNYNLLLLILYENLKKTAAITHLSKLSNEGFLGYDDPYLEIENIKLTHDKLNSLLDLEMINKIPKLKEKTNKKILEIGAGSGRTSEVFMTLNENLNYVICDVPIASVIAFQRLKKVFPNKKISMLYEINAKNKILEEIKKNDISFIFPHQMKFFEEKFFDATLAIDCLQDMDKKIVNSYLNYINKFSSYFYFGIWKKTSFFKKYEFKSDNYDIPKNWELVFKKNSYFPSNFWNICYKI